MGVRHSGQVAMMEQDGRNKLLQEQERARMNENAAVNMARQAHRDGSDEGMRKGFEQGRQEGANMAGLGGQQQAPVNYGDPEAQNLRTQAEQLVQAIQAGKIDPRILQLVLDPEMQQQAMQAAQQGDQQAAQSIEIAQQIDPQVANMALQMLQAEQERGQMEGIPPEEQAGLA